MLTIMINTDSGMEKIPNIQANCWVRVVDPTRDEIAYLSEQLAIPQEYIVSSLDPHELAHVEHDKDTMFIVLQVPHVLGDKADIPYITIPFGIILTHTAIVTVCRTNSSISENVLSERKPQMNPAKKYRFVLILLLHVAKAFLEAVAAINSQIDIVEKRLTVSQRNEEVLQLLKYQKSLVYFTTALRSTELTIDRLEKSELFETYPEDRDLHEDVIIEIRQATEMAEISSNILSQMMDAFASIISNNLNVVMKILAIITILLSFPTLIASIMGMNVTLPFQTNPSAFLIIMLISFVMALATAYYFWRKHWF